MSQDVHKPPTTSRLTPNSGLLLLLGIVPVIVSIMVYWLTPAALRAQHAAEAWLTCVALFLVADLLADPYKYHQWNSYRNLAAVVALLTIGTSAAFGVVIAGAALAGLVRIVFKVRHNGRWLTPLQAVQLALTRSALAGIPLLVSAFVYSTLQGAVPLQQVDGNALLVLGAALAANLVIARLLEAQLIPDAPRMMGILSSVQIVLLMGALPLVFANAGLGVFVVMMSLGATVLVLNRQVDETRYTLSRRVQELSMLNNIGQMTSANLVLDDVLANIYRQVIQFVKVSVFYIALYDKDQNTLDYRMVMANGQPVKWAARKLAGGTVEQIITTKKAMRITASQHRAAGKDFTPAGGFLTFVGVPLMAGTEVLGLMAVMSSESENDFTPDEVTILQTIASQAGLAVRNAVLFTQRTELAENLALINHTMQTNGFSIDRYEALRAVCQTAMTIVDGQKAALLLLDKDRSLFKLAVQIGLSPAHEEMIAHEMSFNADVYNGGIRTIHNPTGMGMAVEYRSAVEVLLQSGGSVLGLLTVYHEGQYYYRKTTLDLLSTLAHQAAAALDNAQLFQALELYAFEMTQLVHFSRITSSSLELETVVMDVAEIFRQMMSVNRVILALVDPADTYSKIHELVAVVNGEPQPARLNGIALADFPELLKPGSAAYHWDEDTVSPRLRQLMSENQEATMAIAPLVTEEALIGFVMLGSQKKRVYTTREWQFMEMAANQITAQIKNVQLYDDTQRKLHQRLEQLSMIEEIAQQVSSSLDLNQTISNVLEAAMQATQADLAAIGLLTDTDHFWIIEQRQLSDTHEVTTEYASQPRDSGMMGAILHTGKPVILRNNAEHPAYHTDQPGVYHSSLVVPLFQNNKVIGALNLESVEYDFFDEQQIGFLNNLASHAVISIENARHLAERQHEIEMLRSLRELSLWLATSDDTHSVAESILEQGLQLLQGQDAVLYNYDEEAEALAVLARSWSQDAGNGRAEWEIPHQLAHQVAQTGQLRIIDDVCESEFYRQGEVVPYTTLAGVPIKRGSQVHSVLVMTFERLRLFLEREINTVELLASQALGHLENAMLHERIRAGRDQMQAILDSTRDGMILLDREVRLVEINPAAQRLLGINLEEHIGEYFPDTLLRYVEGTDETGYSREEAQYLARILRLEPESNTRRQFHHRVRNVTRFIEEIGSPVRDHHQQIIGRLLVLRDVTEEKILSVQREDLTRMMIHDLRAPLGAIISSLELALPSIGYPEEHDEARDLLSSSLISSNRLLRLVNSLLDIAKIEESGMKLTLDSVSVASMVETAYMALMPAMQEADLRMTFDLPADLPLVKADRDKLERVLINLLDNALRYTPKGGEILIRVVMLEGAMQVKVADSGPGIPPLERERIFEKFRRIKNHDPLRGNKGSGLGLTFCKLTIEAHGGRIQVDDDSPLGGACFSFTLPIA